MVGRPEQHGPPRRIEPSCFLDESSFHQQIHGVGGIHPSNLLHHPFGGRLEVGNDGQGFQRRQTELRRLTEIQRLPDEGGILRRRAHLIPVTQLEDTHPPSLESILVRQGVENTLHRVLVLLQHLTQPCQRHRFAGCE